MSIERVRSNKLKQRLDRIPNKIQRLSNNGTNASDIAVAHASLTAIYSAFTEVLKECKLIVDTKKELHDHNNKVLTVFGQMFISKTKYANTGNFTMEEEV